MCIYDQPCLNLFCFLNSVTSFSLSKMLQQNTCNCHKYLCFLFGVLRLNKKFDISRNWSLSIILRNILLTISVALQGKYLSISTGTLPGAVDLWFFIVLIDNLIPSNMIYVEDSIILFIYGIFVCRTQLFLSHWHPCNRKRPKGRTRTGTMI